MVNIEIVLLLSLAAYASCSGSNESNRNEKTNRKGKGKRDNFTGLGSDFLSGFTGSFWDDDESDSDSFWSTHDGKGKSQAQQMPKQNASGSRPSRAHGNSQSFTGYPQASNPLGEDWNNMYDDFPKWMNDNVPPTVPTGMPTNSNSGGSRERGRPVNFQSANFGGSRETRDNQSRTYNYENRYASRGMPSSTDNVRRPGGSRERGRPVNFQSADVGGSGQTQGEIRRGPNIDMTGDDIIIDGKKVLGSSVEFTKAGTYVDGKLDPSFGKGSQRGPGR